MSYRAHREKKRGWNNNLLEKLLLRLEKTTNFSKSDASFLFLIYFYSGSIQSIAITQTEKNSAKTSRAVKHNTGYTVKLSTRLRLTLEIHTLWAIETCHKTFVHTFAKYWEILLILSQTHCGRFEITWLLNSHYTLTASLHYLAKYKFSKITRIRMNTHAKSCDVFWDNFLLIILKPDGTFSRLTVYVIKP